MHIQVGIIDPLRIVAANAAALAIVASQLPAFVRAPLNFVKTALAAVVFSVMMESWHLPVGPSELHLIGATSVYLLFGLPATIAGFGLGLMLQAFLLEPQDILHIGVNSLSLMVPLLAMHASFGRRLWSGATVGERFTFGRVLRLDAAYYAGVSTMVGFWLAVSNDPAPVGDWARWALAYAPVFVLEAVISFSAVTLVHRCARHPLVGHLTAVDRLTFA